MDHIAFAAPRPYRWDMMHPDQLHIDADLVRVLIADQFPQYGREKVEKLETTGTVNAIFRVGSNIAARFPLQATNPAEYAKILRNEAAAMAEFAQHSPVPAPQPMGIGHPARNYPMPWMMQSWIEGDVATPDGLSTSNNFALDIANLIASLRLADTKGRSFSGTGRGGDLTDHDEWIETCFRNSEGLLDVARLRWKWEQLRALPSSGADVMSHCDLIPGNLLARDGHLVGVLDNGGFGPADPALDLVAAWHLFDRERRNILRRHLQSGDFEWKRGAAWAFQQAMGLVWYYRVSNPAMSMLGRSTLSRILDDSEI